MKHIIILFSIFSLIYAQDYYGCTDPDAFNFDHYAEIDDGSCAYDGVPRNLTAIPVDSSGISLSWEFPLTSNTFDQAYIMLWISEVTDSIITIMIESEYSIVGFLFNIETDISAEFGEAFGGIAEESNIIVSTSDSGLILGFSLTGEAFEPGRHVLTKINWTPFETDGCLSIAEDAVLSSNEFCFEIPYYHDICYCYGTCGEDGLLYNLYRDGELAVEEIPNNSYTDLELEPYQTYCYSVAALFDGVESEPSNEICIETIPTVIYGCTDPTALNFNINANVDDDSCIYYGDVNHDLQIDVSDIVLLVEYIMGSIDFEESQLLSADVSGEGDVNILDIILIINLILGE